jgi:hypothetical protein
MTKKEAITFPPALLEAFVAERLRYFKEAIISHPNIDNAKAELLSAISIADPDSLIFFFGPAGVGKSTVRHSTTAEIVAQMLPLLMSDQERLALAGIEMPAPGPRTFQWRETYKLLMQELQEPLIDRKRRPRASGDLANEGNGHRLAGVLGFANKQPSVDDLRHAYEQSLRHRRPKAVLLDDAHYLSKVPGGQLLSQLDLVKSLASRSGIPHVLFGTYELLGLRNLSGQISRRSVDIHLPRYTAEGTDLDCFASAVANLCWRMPLAECPTLVDDSDYLYERSVGCVGILKTWMAKALHTAILKNLPTVTLELMQQQTYSDAALTQMLTEIIEGERTIANSGIRYMEVRGQFFGEHEPNTLPSSQVDGKQASAPKRRSKRRVGERRPTRDLIGKKSKLHMGG